MPAITPTNRHAFLPSRDVDTARLFVALWPGPAVRTRIAALVGGWLWPSGALRVGEAGYHLTMQVLGQVPRHRLMLLAEGLVVPMQPFELWLDRVERGRNQSLILTPSELPDGWLNLQRALAEALRPLGLALPEARSVRPHVTVARRAEGMPLPGPFAPVRWPVTGYLLVEALDSGVGFRALRSYSVASTRDGDTQPSDLPAYEPAPHWQSGPVPF